MGFSLHTHDHPPYHQTPKTAENCPKKSFWLRFWVGWTDPGYTSSEGGGCPAPTTHPTTHSQKPGPRSNNHHRPIAGSTDFLCDWLAGAEGPLGSPVRHNHFPGEGGDWNDACADDEESLVRRCVLGELAGRDSSNAVGAGQPSDVLADLFTVLVPWDQSRPTASWAVTFATCPSLQVLMHLGGGVMKKTCSTFPKNTVLLKKKRRRKQKGKRHTKIFP